MPKKTKVQNKPKKRVESLLKINHLIKDTFVFLWREKKIFGGILLLFAVVSYLFTGGITQQTFLQLKQAATSLITDQADAFGVSAMMVISTFAGESTKGNAELYNFSSYIIFVIFWLILVWSARMRMAGFAMKIRDALYNACTPLISTFAVSVVVAVQLLPAALGLYFVLLAQSGVWAQSSVEVAAITVIGVLLCVASLYFIVSSSIAMVVVTTPQTYPWPALKAARFLVKGKRWAIFMRLFALAVILLLVWSIFLPGSILLAYTVRIDWLPLVPVVFQLLKAFTLVFSVVYIYKLYRDII